MSWGGYAKLLVHLIETDTPLLLSRPSMAKIQLVIDVWERTVTTKMTQKVHYCKGNGQFLIPLAGAKSRGEIPTVRGELQPGWSIDVMKVDDPDNQVTSNNDSTENIVTDPAKVVETLSKPGEQLRRKKDLENHFRTLHEKFNHVGKTTLQHFMERVYEGVDKALLKEIVSEFHCSCEKFDKAGRHPVAALPREPGFNKEVCMDLLFIQTVIILHAMCMFTHLSSSAIV